MGCRNCELLCSLRHYGAVNPAKARIRIDSNEKEAIHKPAVCRQCKNPPCAAACASGAFEFDERLNIYTINQAQCTGCGACAEACPFGAINFDPDTNTALKCDLCGGDPWCIRQCRVLPHVGARALEYK